jgi:hypothetical protein
MAPNTGRFSTQFACARIARRYQSSPSTRSARNSLIGTRPVRIRLQRYTPTVANSSNTVHVANPSSIHTGIVIPEPPCLTPAHTELSIEDSIGIDRASPSGDGGRSRRFPQRRSVFNRSVRVAVFAVPGDDGSVPKPECRLSVRPHLFDGADGGPSVSCAPEAVASRDEPSTTG